MRLVSLLPLLAACGPQLMWEPTDQELELAALDPQPITVPHESDSMSHRSAAFADLKGLEFTRTTLSWAGMSSMACKLFSRSAVFDLDVDPNPTDDDTVVDADDGVVVTTSINAVGLIENDGDKVSIIPVPGVLDARISDRGLVTLSLDEDELCVINFGTGDEAITSKIPGDACMGGFAVDPATSTSFVSTPEGVLRIDPGSVSFVDAAAEVLAWDPVGEQLYAAERHDVVRAYGEDGSLHWESKVAGMILEIATLDQTAGSYVLTTDGHTSTIWSLDADTGATSIEMTVDRIVTDIAVAPQGDMIGIVTQGQVDFFDIE